MSLLDMLDDPRFRPLEAGEEDQYAERLTQAREEGNDAVVKAIRDELIERHLRLVVHIAKNYPALDLEEGFSVGCLALTQAAERWDPDKGHIYQWASRWITTALNRAADASRTIRLPEQVAYRAGLAAKRIAEKEAELGRTLSKEEAQELHEGHTFDQHPSVVASLDMASVNGSTPGARTIHEVVPDPTHDPAKEAELVLLQESVKRAITELSPLEREVVESRFGLDVNERKTLAELGAAHGVSGEAMRRVEAAALAKLRHPAALEPLWGYE